MLHAFASMRCVAILTIAGVAGLVAAASPMERASAAIRDRGPQWDEITQSRSVGTPVMAIVTCWLRRQSSAKPVSANSIRERVR